MQTIVLEGSQVHSLTWVGIELEVCLFRNPL